MRVFVTGLGIVSSLAFGARSTMARLMAGAKGFRPVTLFDTSDQRTSWAAEIPDLSAAGVAPASERETWSRTDAMALLAAREALGEARVDPGRTAIDLVVGGTTGGMFETERLLAEMHRDPSRREPLAAMLSHPLSATADRLEGAVGPFRRARSLCSACSGGANAVLLAGASIRAGRSDLVLAGGADGLCRLTFTGFNALGAVAPEACRPFDRRRAGLGLGEGAAFLVLESEASARARGVTPLAELAAWGVGSEAHHITNPEPGGATAARLMRLALERGQVPVRDLDYVNAHGTGTPLNDAMEAAALRQALGDDVARVAVSSCKGQIGHTLGASGAIEAAITVLAIERQEIPPTGGLEEPDPACELAHVMKLGRPAEVRAALSNSFGFGGTDAVLLFTRPGAAPERRATAARSRVVVTGGAMFGALGLTGPAASLAYLEPGPPPGAASLELDAAAHFDLARARRMDRPARLLALVMQTALRGAASASPPGAAAATGPLGGVAPTALAVVAGSAYGSVDASAEFVQRIYEKGARLASPLIFPNLVPSSPAGHASIYLGVRGPVLTTADLGVTGEAAFAMARELIEGGEARAVLAGSVEERSGITEQVLGPICAGSASWSGVRTEGSCAILVEDEEHAASRGASILCRVAYASSGRGPFPALHDPLPAPSSAAPIVVVARRDAPVLRALAETAWRDVRCVDVAGRSGNHEGLGGVCLLIAAALVNAGRATEALVIGLAPDRWAAEILAAR